MGGKARGPGPRSLELLNWIERLEVTGLEPLALAHRLAGRTAYSHVERLEAAGFVRRIYDRNGSMIAITRAGRIRVRPGHEDPRAAAAALAGGGLTSHARAVSWVAARATLRGLQWVSDREMRTQPAWRIPVIATSTSSHRPDLGYITDGGRIAIEVELSLKAAARLRAITAGYEDHLYAKKLTGVFYVVGSTAIGAAIQRRAIAAGIEQHQLRILPLDAFIADTRARASKSPLPLAESSVTAGS